VLEFVCEPSAGSGRMIGFLMALGGAIGVVIFAFLSWRALGGSEQHPNALDIAQSAPATYRWAGRACAVVFVIGVFRFFTS
jgi:hypothetical protein